MAEKMSINISDSEISGGIFNHSVLGNNNNIVLKTSSNDKDNFCSYLDYIILNSESPEERKCASDAKILYQKGEKDKLKRLIIDNIATFAAGTFSTLAGGALLEIIKGILA